jgi:hypothetical protein
MIIEIFDGWLAAPLKCGTRYLSKLNMNLVRTDSYGMTWRMKDTPFSNLEVFIIRNPIEHLYSALHTECLPVIDNLIEVKSVVDSFIEPKVGGTHYHMELYKRIYDFWCYRNYSFEFVELTRLSYTMEDRGYHYPYYPDDYTFGYFGDKWKSKEEVVDIIKTNFQTEWDILLKAAHTDLRFYENCQSRIKKLM